MDGILDWIDERKSMIALILQIIVVTIIIVAVIVGLIYIIQHTKFATVTGPTYDFYHAEGYYTTQMVETCTTINKVRTCRSSPITTYHPPIWSFHILAEDQDWQCSVDEYIYAQAVQTKQATANCWTWLK